MADNKVTPVEPGGNELTDEALAARAFAAANPIEMRASDGPVGGDRGDTPPVNPRTSEEQLTGNFTSTSGSDGENPAPRRSLSPFQP